MFGVGGPPAIRVEIARKIYQTATGEAVEAVRDLAFSLERGETACLIGPSGAGKSTTLRILLGLDRDFEGRIVAGPPAPVLGAVFQEPRLLPWRDVETNVRLALPRGRRNRQLDALFADLGLTGWRASYPGELSLGMARRVALARALAIEPDILVLDEPFVSLDDAASADLRSLVLRETTRRGAGVLLVTHNVQEALEMADRLLLLTPRPAGLLAEIPLDRPREARDRAWTQALRAELAQRFPSAVAA
jgi:ABC-type nitrate/sulfonate/bicarbonate transport system ATPase subunit